MGRYSERGKEKEEGIRKFFASRLINRLYGYLEFKIYKQPFGTHIQFIVTTTRKYLKKDDTPSSFDGSHPFLQLIVTYFIDPHCSN